MDKVSLVSNARLGRYHVVEVAVDKPQSGDLGARRQKPRPSVTEIYNISRM